MNPTNGPRRAFEHRIQLYKTPPSCLMLVYNRSSRRLAVSITNDSHHLSATEIIAHAYTAVQSLFRTAKVAPDRLIYIAVDLIFKHTSPPPFGGRSKSRAGYLAYNGATVESLLEYILSASFKLYWSCRGRDAVDFVVESLNEALTLHLEQDRDFLNESMLRGMKRAGHIHGSRSTMIPFGLEHVDEAAARERECVTFTPIRRPVRIQPQQTGETRQNGKIILRRKR
ncbi:hypothetical protein BJ741DRAFT_584269 [Chytriomyces cf. hyalinus JEL632]|nr:hypothetical protein BJ741DRAFT_584269 [Chytriomyces cf. hyalinus JEL632]